MFLRYIGEGKWGKLTWESLDYCGSIFADGHKYIGDAISMWNGAVNYDESLTRREAGQGYWQKRKYEKAVAKWEAKIAAIPFWKRLWLDLTGKLPKKPEKRG